MNFKVEFLKEQNVTFPRHWLNWQGQEDVLLIVIVTREVMATVTAENSLQMCFDGGMDDYKRRYDDGSKSHRAVPPRV